MLSVRRILCESYQPDCEYRDGQLVERKGGDQAHALLQAALGAYAGVRRKQWHIQVYLSLRVHLRETCYAIPDVCLYPRHVGPGSLSGREVCPILSTAARADVWKRGKCFVSSVRLLTLDHTEFLDKLWRLMESNVGRCRAATFRIQRS